jgi:hypothetical protein
MSSVNESKYQMALEMVIKMVAERVAANHDWTINRTLDEMSRLAVFDRLSSLDSELWTESPVDLTEMIETELSGEVIDPHYYFK